MMVETAYIISYFGDTPELIEKRKNIHAEQVNFFKDQMGLRVVVCAMNYQDDWAIPGVEYLFREKMSPGAARNVLLKEFYSSSEDFAIFADNDAWFYTGGKYDTHGKDFLKVIEEKGLGYVDLVRPIDGMSTAYGSILESSDVKRNLVFKRKSQFRGPLFILRNFQKQYNDPQWFEPSLFDQPDGTFIPGEDLCFSLNLVEKGYRVYESQNFILKEKAAQDSTWAKKKVDGEENFRIAQGRLMKQVLSERFNIEINEKGVLQILDLYDRHEHPKSRIIIDQTLFEI